ncbi:MAG: T9SS type A sorting domain-containing protein [Bacteroidetes bacterium]|nr:T9SS type A sorting domain-containing protein [Bacteroidota bacterium]
MGRLQIFFLQFITIISYSFPKSTAWNWLNPYPQGNTLNDVQMISDSVGWSVGENGVILHTTDGGNIWVSQESNTYRLLHSVFFTDNNNGVAVGDFSTILITQDAGTTWRLIDSGVNDDRSFHKVFFFDSDTGFIVGSFGVILKTVNGGNSWEIQLSNTDYHFYDIYFHDNNNGIAISSRWENGFKTKILTTSDGGLNWIINKKIISGSATAMTFLNYDNGFISGFDGLFLKTNDGGDNWISIPIMDDFNSFDMNFFDENNGLIIGSIWSSDIYALSTIDGGITWHKILSDIKQHLHSFSFINSSLGVAVGENGNLIKLINSGIDWETNTKNAVTENLNDIVFINDSLGWVVGNSGIILKTDNSGNSWGTTIADEYNDLYCINFTNNLFGITVGERGTIFTTSNGGNTWDKQTSGTSIDLFSVAFLNSSVGIIVGSAGTILKTNNGGIDWVEIESGVNNLLNSITFIDNQNVIIVGAPSLASGMTVGEACILHSSDQGITWKEKRSGTYAELLDVSFFDINNGISLSRDGELVRSSNGGNTWELVSNLPQGSYSDFYFHNYYKGYAIGSNGKILRTMDAGETWHDYSVRFSYWLNGITFIDGETGFVVGDHGAILKTFNGGLTNIEDNETSINIEYYSLHQNYPNPFNNSTRLRYEIPFHSNVKLSLYNNIGQEIKFLVNKELPAGTHYYDFQICNMASGVYFISLISGDSKQTIKIVLIK